MNTVVEQAEVAVDAVRAVNRETLWGGGYEWPSDVDATIGAFERLTHSLEQALRQANGWLVSAHTAGRIGDDRQFVDPRPTVLAANVDLLTAAAKAKELGGLLGRIRNQTSHLTGVSPTPPDRQVADPSSS